MQNPAPATTAPSAPGGNRIRRLSPTGDLLTAYAPPEHPDQPRTIADFLARPDGSLIVLEAELTTPIANHRAEGRLTLSTVGKDGRAAVLGTRAVAFGRPADHQALLLDRAGTIHTVGSGELTRWPVGGAPAVVARNELFELWTPSCVLFDSRGRLLLPDSRGLLMRLDPATGARVVVAGPGGALLNGATVDTSLRLANYPTLAEDGTLYLVDRGNKQIKQLPMASVEAVP